MRIIKTAVVVILLVLTQCVSNPLKQLNIVQTQPAEVLDVDTSGMMVDYGGQLINKRQSIFCTHWNIFGKEVTFIARNGEKVKRTVIAMNRLGYDICIVTFDRALDPKQHWIAPVADIEGEVAVTIFRYKERAPISVKVTADVFVHGPVSTEFITFECIPGKSVRPGDSGKGWYAKIDGKIHLVGINSFILQDWTGQPRQAFSPEVGEVFNPKNWILK